MNSITDINNIKAVVFDIDGVLTDGTISIDSDGTERKSINLSDADHINRFKRDGFKIAAITGEDTGIVDFFKKKFEWDSFSTGCKNKDEELKKVCDNLNIPISDICYIGDGFYDIPAIKIAGFSACPSNAIYEVKRCVDVIIDKEGGHGCIAELYNILAGNRCIVDNKNTSIILDNLVERYSELFQIKQKINDAFCVFRNTFVNGKKLLICGNGGSASDSEHIVGELMKKFTKKRQISESLSRKLIDIDCVRGNEMAKKLECGLTAMSLTTHEALATAFGNDVDNKLVYAQQLLGYGRKGDTLLAISTSGNSENVINAVILAKAMGVNVVGLTGASGGKLATLADVCVIVPKEETYMIQELHLPIYHCWCMMLEEYFF